MSRFWSSPLLIYEMIQIDAIAKLKGCKINWGLLLLSCTSSCVAVLCFVIYVYLCSQDTLHCFRIQKSILRRFSITVSGQNFLGGFPSKNIITYKKKIVFGQKPAFLEPSKISWNFTWKSNNSKIVSNSVNFGPIWSERTLWKGNQKVPEGSAC